MSKVMVVLLTIMTTMMMKKVTIKLMKLVEIITKYSGSGKSGSHK